MALVLLVGFTWPQGARAQEGGYIIDNNTLSQENVALASVDFDQAFNMIENPYLADIMKINYQINLLTKMVERQAEISKIQEAYGALGISYEGPPPSRGICKQLPVNAACLKAYPELYEDLVQARRAHYEALTQDTGAPSGADEEARRAEAERLAREEEARRIEAEKAERRTRYLWSDISCLSGNCRAVIVTSSGNGYRATVRTGDRLADGTRIMDVSGDGVIVNIEGDRIALRPKAQGDSTPVATGSEGAILSALGGRDEGITPATGVSASGAGMASGSADTGATGSGMGNMGAGNMSAQAAATTGGGAGTSRAPQATPGIAPTAGGQAIDQPALGPSGLF